MSYRRRLMLLAALAVSLAVALASVAIYVSVRAQLRDAVDDTLRSLAGSVGTAPTPQRGVTQRRQDPELERRQFLLLLPSSPLGEHAGYAQVVSSAGRIQPPPDELALLAAGPRVVAVARGRRRPFFYDSELSGTEVRVYVSPFGDGQALQAARSLQDVNSTMRRLTLVLVLVSLAGIGLAAVLGGVVGRSAMAPVRRLMRGTRYVAVTQDLSRRVDAIGDDELASLARSFNAMLEALAESRRAQRRLIADASHELRTPLTTVQANVELLARAGPELGPDERRQLREDLLSQLRELTALVGDLVELARERPPESGLEELELDALVAGCVERARAREPRAAFVCALHPCRVRADRPRLERAVTNLLDNARKWSPPGGAVEVEVADGELVVRDEGPGIDTADLPYVFDRFYRSADARRLPGSGLGLAIVRQVAEMHGGAVWAAPPRTGRGAELHLRLSGVGGTDSDRQPNVTSATSMTGPTSS